MQTITFKGLAGADFGSDLSSLSESFTRGAESLHFFGMEDINNSVISAANGSNGGSGTGRLTFTFSMSYLGGRDYVVTAITVTMTGTSATADALTATGLSERITVSPTDENDLNFAKLIADLTAISKNLMLGDDRLLLSGPVAEAWGDADTVTGQNVVLGNDIIESTLMTLASGQTEIVIAGDAMTVAAGSSARGGNDTIFAVENVAHRIFGDFRTIQGTASFGNDSIFGGFGADIMFGDSNASATAGGGRLSRWRPGCRPIVRRRRQ